MPITINGSGTVTGISAGGLPDGIIKAAELDGAQTGTAPIYGCRAWVNFNGTGTIGTNQTIRASGNVTSVLKNGTGDYTITFTTAMPDANYCVVAMGKAGGTTYGNSWSTNVQTDDPTASTVRVSNSYQDDNSNTVAYIDSSHMYLAIFR